MKILSMLFLAIFLAIIGILIFYIYTFYRKYKGWYKQTTVEEGLFSRYNELEVGNEICFPNISSRVYIVVENHLEDVLYVLPKDNLDAGFHIFYNNLDLVRDDFILVKEVTNEI